MSKNFFRQIVILAAVVLVLGVLYIGSTNLSFDKQSAAHIDYRIADSYTERAQGLSGTAPLQDDEAMLFVFEKEGKYPFWMKGMNYALDIVWIDASSTIVHMEENISPDTYPNKIGGDVSALYVVEGTSGFIKRHSWELGQIIVLPVGGLK
jgi:uncharacterized membrane protein (UPF0127 family)